MFCGPIIGGTHTRDENDRYMYVPLIILTLIIDAKGMHCMHMYHIMFAWYIITEYVYTTFAQFGITHLPVFMVR